MEASWLRPRRTQGVSLYRSRPVILSCVPAITL
jgi:hypothetical protein